MIDVRNRHNLIILIAIVAFLSAGFAIRYSLHKIDSELPKIEVRQGADGIKNINVTVTLPQIKKDIAPIIIEDFLSQTKITTLDKGGLKLVDFKDNSPLARYGFKKGDIVKEINGQKLNSVGEAVNICEALEKEVLKNSDAKEVNVALSRGSEDINMNFKIPAFIPERVSYSMVLEKTVRE